jgi:hypothetical protein
MALAYSPIIAAIFFVVGTLMRLVAFVRYINRKHFDAYERQDLRPSHIEKEWQYRRDESGLVATYNCLNAMAWVILAIPMLQVAWALSRGGQRKVRTHGAIVGFALTGIITELISRLLSFGGKSSALWISSSFNLDVWLPQGTYVESDKIGWRALEVTYLIANGMTTFIDAFEWVCLSVILVLIAYSVGSMQDRVFNVWWSRFGLLIAFLCVFDLVGAIVLLYDQHTYTLFAVSISVINMLIFLPVWLTMLAIQLPKALPTYVPARDMEPAFSQ